MGERRHDELGRHFSCAPAGWSQTTERFMGTLPAAGDVNTRKNLDYEAGVGASLAFDLYLPAKSSGAVFAPGRMGPG